MSMICDVWYRPCAVTLSITGDVYAPNNETITAITNPAIGPAIAMSNNISLFIVILRD